MRYVLKGWGLLFFLLLIIACSEDEDFGPEEILLSASSDTLLADGEDHVSLKVVVYDGGKNIIKGEAFQLYVNGEKLASLSFKTSVSGKYNIVAKIGDISSNPVIINAFDPEDLASSIVLSATAPQLVANGADVVNFDVKVFDKDQKRLMNADYDLLINGEKHGSSTFSTITAGAYEVVAKINSLESNRVILQANTLEEMLGSLVLKSDTELIIADGTSMAKLSVEAFDKNNKLLTGLDSEIFINGIAHDGFDFSSSQGGEYEIVAKSGRFESNKINLYVREQKNYPEINIPVIFHIVHFGEAVGVGNNLKAVEVTKLLEKLNTGFSNSRNSSNPNAVDTHIRFRLATLDPDNNTLPEPGIHRLNGQAYDIGSPSNKRADRIMPIPSARPGASAAILAVKGDIAGDKRFGYDESFELGKENTWNRSEYYNIYLLPIQEDMNLAGYAYLPFLKYGGPFEGFSVYPGYPNSVFEANEVCVLDNYYAIQSHAYTIVHEAGHSLGLNHVFSDDKCSSSDFCEDTHSYDYEDIHRKHCPDNRGLATYDNFMDYGGSYNTFTFDQRERMRHVLSYGYFFSELKESGK